MIALLRRLGRGLLLWLLQVFPEGKGGVVGPPRSILVIRTDDRVGNLLLTTPLLAALREAFPQTRLGLLCAARRSAVVEGTGLYDELWRFEKRDLFRRPWRFVALCWRLRAARYAVAIDAGHFHVFSFTSAALARWSGAPMRIGHRRGAASRLLTDLVDHDPRVIYDAATKLELLSPLGVAAPSLAPLKTRLGLSRLAEFQALLGRAVVVNPGGRKADHRHSPAELALATQRVAAALGLKPFVAWGPGEEPLARQVATDAGAVLLPPTDLEGLAAAFRAAALVITNDTGPMHLAVAVGAPTMALFVKRDYQRWVSPQPHFEALWAEGALAPKLIQEVVAAAGRLTRGPAAS